MPGNASIRGRGEPSSHCLAEVASIAPARAAIPRRYRRSPAWHYPSSARHNHGRRSQLGSGAGLAIAASPKPEPRLLPATALDHADTSLSGAAASHQHQDRPAHLLQLGPARPARVPALAGIHRASPVRGGGRGHSILPRHPAGGFFHGPERHGIAQPLDRRQAVLPLRPRLAAQQIGRTRLRRQRDPLPLRPLRAESSGAVASARSDHVAEHGGRGAIPGPPLRPSDSAHARAPSPHPGECRRAPRIGSSQEGRSAGVNRAVESLDQRRRPSRACR